ncbi:unnamed protein product [Bursaphelenchus okinawaensis]|uniref:G_PROTEIN_RECEP_F1_2 domain-containing protein n=1 Tax=Bursaphelenchus okinawaensis TaxID=465554 RepID=A0A811LNW2_9BILA|nr:unnamed protein product [Bursaphelenchus okinawaensis]CAG9124666.1 unnamed protein product [Bursaphelenchus okinawaensis]
MDLMLRRSEYFEQHWNCTVYNASEVPLEAKEHKIFGMFLFAVSTMYIFLSIPCSIAMCHKELIQNACYKIMLLMAFCDMVTVQITGFISGYLSYYGLMYCDARKLNNIGGCILLSFWISYTWGSMILAINRISYMLNKSYWFEGYKVYVWISMPILIGLYSSVFGLPVTYSPIIASWVFNPFTDTVPDVDKVYVMRFHTVNNVLFTVLLPAVYIAFIYKNMSLLRQRDSQKMSARDYSLFMQCLIISAATTMATLGYTVIQIFRIPIWMSQLSHVLWMFIQGCPPLIYLSMNKSIQRILLSKFGCTKKANAVHSTSNVKS